MRLIIFLIPIFLFLGCNKTAQIDLRSIPSGAKIYDTDSKKLIAKTPAEVTYVFDNDLSTPECELIPSITAVWGDYDSIITEKNIILCPNRDYKITINQHTFRKPIDYKLVKYKDIWSITPYFGVNYTKASVNVDILNTNVTASNYTDNYFYKIGFIDEDNNRIELNYSILTFQENDLNLYSIDTIIPISRLKVKIVEPYFRFGAGYADYIYDNKTYVNLMYTLGLGVYTYINKDIELDLGFSKTSHINYSSLADEFDLYSKTKPDSRIDIYNLLLGINYKF